VQADESERIWRELCGVSRRVEAIERSAQDIERCRERLDEIESRLPDLLDRGDLIRLRDSIDALERSVMGVLEWERDSVVIPQPAPKLSISPSAKLRGEVWKWALLALAVALSGAAGAVAQSCSG